MKKINYIWSVASKSAGHMLPCFTLAREERKKDRTQKVFFFTTTEPLDAIVTENQEIIYQRIQLVLRSNFGNIFTFGRFVYDLIRVVVRTFYYGIWFRPKKIITTGGFIAIPVCLVGWVMRIPIEVYELNAVPGRAVLLLAKIATRVFVCFDEVKTLSKLEHCTKRSYPFYMGKKAASVRKEDARLDLGMDPEKVTIMITGGSQGSIFLNHFVRSWIESETMDFTTLQFIHQIGLTDAYDWNSFYQRHGIAVSLFSYKKSLTLYYQAADLVICRSGAGTLLEAMFLGKKCITIPLVAKTGSHQVDNAYAVYRAYPRNIAIFDQILAGQNPIYFFTRMNHFVKTLQEENENNGFGPNGRWTNITK